MRFAPIALVILFGLRFLFGQEPGELGFAKVTVRVFDPWGKRLDGASVDLIDADGQKVNTLKPEVIISRIPWGSYTLRARVAGYVYSRPIMINSVSVYAMIAMPFPRGDSEWPGGNLKIQGQIQPGQPAGSFVRVRGVFLDHQAEAEVDKSGSFSVGGLHDGSYAVEVFSPSGRLLAARSIALDSRDPVREIRIRIAATRDSSIE